MKLAILGAVTGTAAEEYSIFDTYFDVAKKYFDKKDIFVPASLEEFRLEYQAKHKSAEKAEVLSKMVEFDFECVSNSDIVIADISRGSTGLGMELVRCTQKKICFFAKEGAVVSDMVEGLFPEAPIVRYTTPQDLARKLDGIIQKCLKFGTFIRTAKKAGCIFFDPNTKKVGLIYRDKQDDYSFPKGHLEEGETLIECAIRETAEETKRDVKLISEKPVAEVVYVDGSADKSIVEYYLAVDIGPSANTSTDTHELVWKDLEEVEAVLTYPELKDIWKKAYPKIKEYKIKR